jgi:hypothetical protein
LTLPAARPILAETFRNPHVRARVLPPASVSPTRHLIRRGVLQAALAGRMDLSGRPACAARSRDAYQRTPGTMASDTRHFGFGIGSFFGHEIMGVQDSGEPPGAGPRALNGCDEARRHDALMIAARVQRVPVTPEWTAKNAARQAAYQQRRRAWIAEWEQCYGRKDERPSTPSHLSEQSPQSSAPAAPVRLLALVFKNSSTAF